jgi:cobyrinic acid a,c-diamide synthase
MKGFVLAGTASGVGKTVATLAVCRALDRKGFAVQPAKAGPDFIDPSHHEYVTDRPSRTLDPWLQGEDGMRRNYHRSDGDICVVEGMMGLYDGSVASTASVAAGLSLPVILIIDATAGMQSVAASALGFREYADHTDVDIDVVGVLAQKAHGGRHEEGIREALPDGLRYFGRIPPRDDLEIPERHLGLQMGEESPVPDEALDAVTTHVRADRLLEVAKTPSRAASHSEPVATDVTVAVAADAAFCFHYSATLEQLAERATVQTFSPVADDSLPNCDAVYLPGGYPERYGEALAASRALSTLADRAADGLPILGECGGLMTLSDSLTTVDGETYPMAGVLPAEVEMCERYQALDHVELRADETTVMAGAGGTLRGHEFHYSSAELASDAHFAFDVVRGEGVDGKHDGLTEYSTLGTYCHVHPESGAFDLFLDGVG